LVNPFADKIKRLDFSAKFDNLLYLHFSRSISQFCDLLKSSITNMELLSLEKPSTKAGRNAGF
jgi:hypothetical protein